MILEILLKKYKKGDFVYLDPPYVPENSISFVGYVADGFNAEMHEILFNEIKKKWMVVKFLESFSNLKVDMVLESFSDYNCEDIYIYIYMFPYMIGMLDHRPLQ